MDDDDDADDASPNGNDTPDVDYDGCLAIVVSAGAKTTSKAGQTVITSAWARDGMKLGDGLVLAGQYDVLGTITE